MSLVQLPYELVSYVVQHLGLGDICSLSYSCKRFMFLVHEANITKKILEVSDHAHGELDHNQKGC
jgi:hypothetical protein